LILVEIKSQPRIKLKDLAEKLDITVQGVSEYLKLMIQDNLVIKINGDYRITQIGVEFLHKNMSELKSYIDNSIKDLDIINACTAVAGEDLKKDERVGLVMEKGTLIAKKAKRSKSSGMILYSAKAGEEVAIVDLDGIVDFKYGEITILELPSILNGGTRPLNLKKIEKLIKKIKYDKIVVADIIGKNLFRKLKITPDIEFSAVPATIEAAQKGLNVLLTTPSDMLASTILIIEKNNSKSKNKIKYSIIPLSEINQ
jgi:putative transcriptional regulator